MVTQKGAEMVSGSAEELVVTLSELEMPHVVHGFSSRQGGVSVGAFSTLNLGLDVGDVPREVEENRRRLMAAMGVEGFAYAMVKQVHGSRVVAVEEVTGPVMHLGEADALVTSLPGVLLTVRVADCVPILLASHRVVAAVHAGWRGTAARIGVEVVEYLFQRYDVHPSELKVGIGPAIGQECYEVGLEVVAALKAALGTDPTAMDACVREEEGRYWVDLKEANRRLLITAGVLEESIGIFPHCVSCHSQLFYSHRRDKGVTGRMVGAIARREGGRE